MENIDYFDGIIGQINAKKTLSFSLDCQRNTGVMRNFLVVGGFGLGKTKICKQFASHVVNYPNKSIRPFIEVNCSSIDKTNSFNSFWDEVLFPYGIKQSFTIILDEAHNMPDECQNHLLTILNPNSEHKNTYNHLGTSYTFDFRQNNFIFSTSDPNKLLTALIQRLKRVDLDGYDINQLSEIIKGETKEINIGSDLLKKIASVTRKNARQAVELSQDIVGYSLSRKISEFEYEHWEDFRNQLSIFNLGLNMVEIRILKALKERGSMSLTSLSSLLNSNAEAIRAYYEPFLLSEGLMHIEAAKGRGLTKLGQEYINSL